MEEASPTGLTSDAMEVGEEATFEQHKSVMYEHNVALEHSFVLYSKRRNLWEQQLVSSTHQWSRSVSASAMLRESRCFRLTQHSVSHRKSGGNSTVRFRGIIIHYTIDTL